MPRYNRLRLCELCGTRFIDDDYKDDHLNSCPKLPTFHEVESFNSGPPGKWTPLRLLCQWLCVLTLSLVGPLQNFLNRLHL